MCVYVCVSVRMKEFQRNWKIDKTDDDDDDDDGDDDDEDNNYVNQFV